MVTLCSSTPLRGFRIPEPPGRRPRANKKSTEYGLAVEQRLQPGARTNNETRGKPRAPIRVSPARSSSSLRLNQLWRAFRSHTKETGICRRVLNKSGLGLTSSKFSDEGLRRSSPSLKRVIRQMYVG